jgi:hypothetical protein
METCLMETWMSKLAPADLLVQDEAFRFAPTIHGDILR